MWRYTCHCPIDKWWTTIELINLRSQCDLSFHIVLTSCTWWDTLLKPWLLKGFAILIKVNLSKCRHDSRRQNQKDYLKNVHHKWPFSIIHRHFCFNLQFYRFNLNSNSTHFYEITEFQLNSLLQQYFHFHSRQNCVSYQAEISRELNVCGIMTMAFISEWKGVDKFGKNLTWTMCAPHFFTFD